LIHVKSTRDGKSKQSDLMNFGWWMKKLNSIPKKVINRKRLR